MFIKTQSQNNIIILQYYIKMIYMYNKHYISSAQKFLFIINIFVITENISISPINIHTMNYEFVVIKKYTKI